MTKKNAAKLEARARQERHGGCYLHHFHVVSAAAEGDEAESSGANALAMTTERLVWLAREYVPEQVVRLREKLGDEPVVYASIDPADPTGEAMAAHSFVDEEGIPLAAALERVRSTVKARTAKRRMTYGELTTWRSLRSLLERALPSDQWWRIAPLGACFTTPPPSRQVHVLAVAAGELHRDLVPSIELCHCGHPKAEHDERGACTFFGIPELGPFLGTPKEMVALARMKGIPLRCCCAGPLWIADDKGRMRPFRGPAILKD